MFMFILYFYIYLYMLCHQKRKLDAAIRQSSSTLSKKTENTANKAVNHLQNVSGKKAKTQ